MASRSPLPVSDLTETRIGLLLTERDAVQAELRGIDFQLKALCRMWSDAHGYRVRLDAQQIKRAIEAAPKREDAA